jgi:K+/H+ antiporter YhaU regulatory subunit KhtT
VNIKGGTLKTKMDNLSQIVKKYEMKLAVILKIKIMISEMEANFKIYIDQQKEILEEFAKRDEKTKEVSKDEQGNYLFENAVVPKLNLKLEELGNAEMDVDIEALSISGDLGLKEEDKIDGALFMPLLDDILLK